ncbi:MAG: pyridoxamine 5'-phosphate oxidase family protein, partial [Flavobacteriaceae bacterium]|nr:pyridoxamine 5'-phosphate oxidase family protein [Flavobacteriaceae bacterium]
DGYIYCHSKNGMKIEMMNKNPKVCFEVDQIENMNSWRCVILWGEYEKLESDTAREEAAHILSDRLGPISTGETVVPYIRQDVPSSFRIKIVEQTGRFEKVQQVSL